MPTKNAKPSVSVISLLLCGRLLQPTPPLYWRSRRELPTGLSAANQPREAHVHPRRSRRRVSLALSRAGRSTMAYRTGQPRRKGTGVSIPISGLALSVHSPAPARLRSPQATVFCFHQLTNCPICKPFVLKTLQQWGGVVGGAVRKSTGLASARSLSLRKARHYFPALVGGAAGASRMRTGKRGKAKVPETS